MSDAIDEAHAAADAQEAMRESLLKLIGDFSPATTPKKAARKQREKQVRSIVDGRALKSKGRTEQLNVKVRPDIKKALAARVDADGTTIADWIEATLEAALGLKGK